ncbi:demethylmenaquinone methyltransferase [Pelotomaculum terephthalicicum JT]|uniref:demethylmenaquinone methyltransferase n=1 Tax=Pelotomaculum TaxID=191373 RepID=UPI0009C943C8|nr:MULTISPECIES: demethylmenaquinone methyltransferase [Pelotomaculum]MCG9966473.1 demethylmenaquinone methyltransferase [Pelotomaculum terephthalicicum JT]OPX85970.1 MAG: Demethylmenaquinone methyltransferase [Pelotomaculum sp. PtaB.Bin117]OPY63386.1 MAG: Demethylmenaquinone methyltransferase [Pelotomaculum sp. PtaU1.Bin065]
MRPDQYRSKEEYVHAVFSSIAHRYDFLNTALSFNRDKYWRKFAVKLTGLTPGGEGLDVCCGTGMLTLELAKAAGLKGRVVGVDFCADMLAKAVVNIGGTPYREVIELVEGNALSLPFPENTFDCATIGFALRNVPDIRKTIDEMRRVVKPGGKVVSLEFAKPGIPVFKQIYYFYLNCVIPVLGRLGAGLSGPYKWLPESLKMFPHQSEIRDIFTDAGLTGACYYELTGGIVAVHVGEKRHGL